MATRTAQRVEVIDSYVLRHLVNYPARGARYSTSELAVILERSRSYMGHLLTGARRTLDRDLAARLAEVIGVPPQCLFTPWLSADSDTAPKEGK